MYSTLTWLKENTDTTFSHYTKSKEGAWISPHTLPGHEDNAIWNNTTLGKSVLNKYSTTAWETDFLEQLLPSLISSHKLCSNTPLIDLGCGNGRVTYLLHRVGFNKLVGIDLDEKNVNYAASQIPASSSDDIIFMMGNALHLPFKQESLSQIFVSALPFLTTVFSSIKPLIKQKGKLLYLTFTSLEAALTYALVRNDWEEFVRIMETQTRAAAWENKSIRYTTPIAEEIIMYAEEAGFSLEAQYGIPIFASLIFGALCQQQTLNEDKKEFLYNKLHELASISNRFVRQHLLIFQKE